MADGVFTFPAGMALADAEAMLGSAYGSIPEGALLRRTLKEQRRAGLDPPTDVQYVAEPVVEASEAGLAVALHADILVYEDFDDAEGCLRVFEDVVSDELGKRLGKLVAQRAKDGASGRR